MTQKFMIYLVAGMNAFAALVSGLVALTYDDPTSIYVMLFAIHTFAALVYLTFGLTTDKDGRQK